MQITEGDKKASYKKTPWFPLSLRAIALALLDYFSNEEKTFKRGNVSQSHYPAYYEPDQLIVVPPPQQRNLHAVVSDK